jgi:hypothetical protein
MKTIRLLLTVALVIPFLSCNSQSPKNEIKAAPASSDKVEAYYFHFTARCTTCRTIEAKAKENLEILYPNQVKQGLITFQSLNLEEAANKPLAEKLGVSGQALLLVKGDQKINLTNEGFMYAVAKPEKFREIINEKVDGLLVSK